MSCPLLLVIGAFRVLCFPLPLPTRLPVFPAPEGPVDAPPWRGSFNRCGSLTFFYYATGTSVLEICFSRSSFLIFFTGVIV